MNNGSLDDLRYKELQDTKNFEWEKKCKQCGACCGSVSGDMCVHLVKNGEVYGCNIYGNRFGIHKTITGKELVCVPIRDILHKDWPGREKCAYKKGEI
ncbi:MAG: hypothetical protein ABH848_05935 [Candidatus Omnitrophota bacterium]